MLAQIVQQEAAIGDRPAGDVRGMRRQVQAFAARTGVPPHEALARGRVFLALAGREFGEADLGARPENIVLGDQRIDDGLLFVVQRVIGGAHIGEFGLAAAKRRSRRHRDREQHAQHDRHRHVGGVGVP